MKISASLGIDVIALEQDEQVSALVELTAPPVTSNEERSATKLVVVLDRSGSMGGERLNEAKAALRDLVQRLRATDSFGLVVFDDAVGVPVAAGPLADKPSVLGRIQAIDAGGCTDLGAGYLRGLQEARRIAGGEGATVLLVSDGHANSGLTDADTLAGIARTATQERVTTSALGFGLGYDETLLSAVAKGGNGNELFAESADAAGGAIAGEIDGLLSQSIQAASLLVAMSPHVRAVRVVNELTSDMVQGGLQIELGGFYAEETRKLLLAFDIPGMSALGLAQVATLTVRYVDVTTLKEQVVEMPLHVNVVPGDEAAGRIANPVVVTELAFQRAQRVKRDAVRSLSIGDVGAAGSGLHKARDLVSQALAVAPPAQAAELRAESHVLEQMMAEAEYGSTARAAKAMSMDVSYKSRTRGRQRPSG